MQQQIQNTPMQMAQEMNKRFHEILAKEKFPASKISDEWFQWAKWVLKQASPLSLGCSAQEMKDLFEATKEDLTFGQFALLSNHLEGRSIQDFNGDIDSYFAAQKHTQELANFWNEWTKDLRTKIQADVTMEFKAKGLMERNKSKLAQA